MLPSRNSILPTRFGICFVALLALILDIYYVNLRPASPDSINHDCCNIAKMSEKQANDKKLALTKVTPELLCAAAMPLQTAHAQK